MMDVQHFYQVHGGQKRGQMDSFGSNWKDPSYMEYLSPSESSDYIARPVYSDADYIAKQPENEDEISYHDYERHRLHSDFLSRPYESSDDYFLDQDYEIDPSVAPERDSKRSSYQDQPSSRVANSFSTSDYYATLPPESPESPQPYWPSDDRDTQHQDYTDEISDYRLIKDGGWEHKHDFMHSYGLKTWETEDSDEAREILNGFRKIDTQNACPPEVSYRRSGIGPSSYNYRPRNYGNDTQTRHWSDVKNQPEEEDMYANDSDVSSYRSGMHSGLASPISPTAGSEISASESSDDDDDDDEPYASYDENNASDIIRDLSDFSDDDDDDDDAGNESGFADRSDVDSIGSSDVASMSSEDGGSGDEQSDAEYGDDHVEDGYDGYDEDDGSDDD